jgi:hypothetical protein
MHCPLISLHCTDAAIESQDCDHIRSVLPNARATGPRRILAVSANCRESAAASGLCKVHQPLQDTWLAVSSTVGCILIGITIEYR